MNPERHSIEHWRGLARSHNYRPDCGPYEPAMTFGEIAEAMGTDVKHVYFWYVTGIRKLRENPEALYRLLEVADSLEGERQERLRGKVGL
jgi:hypothetical protein